jgi:hypothetical protein
MFSNMTLSRLHWREGQRLVTPKYYFSKRTIVLGAVDPIARTAHGDRTQAIVACFFHIENRVKMRRWQRKKAAIPYLTRARVRTLRRYRRSKKKPGWQPFFGERIRSQLRLVGHEEPIAEYVGGEIRDYRVSVKWLESDPDYDPEDPNAGNYVHLCIEVWALDGTEEDADCWSCDFFHFVSHIQGILPTYLNRWCPFPARVWETAATVPLPNELKGLFDQEERPYANN